MAALTTTTIAHASMLRTNASGLQQTAIVLETGRDNLKAIVATGFGKLYFHETARALVSAGIEVNFLTGWVPEERHAMLVDRLGRLIGEQHLAKRMAARRIPGATVTPVAWAEVAGSLISLVQRGHLLSIDLAYGLQFRIAAWASRKYLKGADALLVRSGAGQSGAIDIARKNGLAIVVDHSIAHPAFIHEILGKEFARFGLGIGYNPKTDLWKLVLRDCSSADLLMVNSDFVKDTFVELGFPARKIRVAYLGVRETFFDLKHDYRIDGPVRILFTGNFDLRKGVRVLLEAIRQCRQRGLDLRLEVIGNLASGKACLLPSDSEFFTHTPFVPQAALTAALARADLFVFPTYAEGSSRSAMEAAAAGLPVITTKNCGLPLEDGASAIYVPVNDAESLADAISRAASDQVLRECLGRNAVRMISQQYTWEQYGQRVRGILSEAIQLSGSGKA
jgi:glycosyltransferase involved in cell wall biosynthesis